MSNSGKKSPLQLNVESQLTVNKGFRLNPTAVGFQGVWTAGTPYTTPTAGSYNQGTITSTNCTGILTSALPNFYAGTPSTNSAAVDVLCVPVFRNTIKIGRPNDSRRNNNRINCPALGNSRPDKFITWFPGYGTFKETTGTPDQFYNYAPSPGSGNWNLVESTYPPFSYPASPEHSYVYQNWSSLVPGPGATTDPTYGGFAAYEQPYQYYQEYAWVTGWPGINPWQQNNAFGSVQNRQDPNINGVDLDSYGAAYFPRPDLAGTMPWRNRDKNKIEYDEYFRFGYMATVARQGYYQFWSEYSARRSNQYYEFCRSINQNYGWQTMTNMKIVSFYETKTFLKGTYSNINDLTTADLAGVNLAFRDFGNDMINLGKTINLATINEFGLPSSFLKHLQANSALTDALKFALMYQNLDTTELELILQPTSLVTVEQERKIYEAFLLIQGEDLINIRVILNIATEGLTSLADLLNPRRMFPNSYMSLTVPRYSLENNSAKIYDFIYNGVSTNNRIDNWGAYLEGILPIDIAKAAGAFMCTMCQVKNIQQMNVEALSQAIANLEVTNKDLPLINTNTGVPGNVELADQELARIALGSGSMGMFRFADFLGAMSGWPYRDWYAPAQALLQQLQTTPLTNVYRKLYQKSLFNNWALIGRGKGYPDAEINTTGINPQYTYDLFTVNANQNSSFSCIGTVRNIVTIGPLPINVYSITATASGRSDQADQLPTTDFKASYSTGQLMHFSGSVSSDGGNSGNSTSYIITEILGPNTVKVESTINLLPRKFLSSSTNPPAWTGFPTFPTRWYSDNGGNVNGIPVGWRYEPCTYNLGTTGFNFVTAAGSLSATREVSPGVFETYTAAYLDVSFGNVQAGGYFYSPLPYPGWPGLAPGVGTAGQYSYSFEEEYNGYPGNGILDGTVQNLVDGANLEILRIQNANPEAVSKLNYYWDRIGTQQCLEQRAMPLSVPYTGEIFSGANRSDIDAYVRSLEEYAQNTNYCEIAPIIDAISDLDDVGGQSMVAGQREARNARRLINVGTDVNNDVPDASVPTQATARAIVNGIGLVTEIEVLINGSGYSSETPPGIFVYPQGGVFGGEVFCNTLVCGIPVIIDGAIVSIPVISCDPCYNPDLPPIIVIDPPPQPVRPGGPIVPGSWVTNPYAGNSQDPVPNNLTTKVVDEGGSIPSSLTPDQAIQDVTNCNCECWQEPN
jgi:hypothetical protein